MKVTFEGKNGFVYEDGHSYQGYTPVVHPEQGIFLQLTSRRDFSNLYLGWERQPFPLCCGVDIVFNFGINGTFSEEVLDKWYQWAIYQTYKPAIGWIPKLLDKQNSVGKSTYPVYEYFLNKGIPISSPLKNIIYDNHVLIPLIFCQDKDEIFNPKYGLILKCQQ